MHQRLVVYAGLLAGLLATMTPGEGHACYWDKDTLAMEQRAFPELLNLILGRVRTRSTALYRWRIQDRRAKLGLLKDRNKQSKSKPAAAARLRLLDDLAVAYDKLGRHDEAIATAERALTLAPKRYETLANLGTFHFHRRRAKDRDLQRGMSYIQRALKINPNAHFGRERYQLWLVQYLMARGKRFDQLPLAARLRGRGDSYGEGAQLALGGKGTFRAFLAKKLPPPTRPPRKLPRQGKRAPLLAAKARDAAVKGIAGMLRFGNNDSPILLEALVSLLLNGGFRHRQNHSHLAVFALWRAAEHPRLRPAVRKAYLRLGRSLARTIRRYEHRPQQLLARYQKRRRAAKRWLARRHLSEERRIKAGKAAQVDGAL